MLLRLISSPVTRVLRLPCRGIRTSAALSGGGGHHPEVPPVYIPRPAPPPTPWYQFGKTPSMYPSEPYKAGPEDYASYFGAGAGVLLTILAVVFYTDVFGMNRKSKDHGHVPIIVPKVEVSQHVEPTQVEAKHDVAPVEEIPPSGSDELVETADAQFAENETTTAAVEKSIEESHSENEVDSVPTTSVKISEEHDAAPAKSNSEPAVPQQSDTTSSSEECDGCSPSSSDKIPEKVEYLLVGAGTASYYAALAIRARDAEAKVLIIGEENHLPYNRPPLSKELWWYGDEKARQSLEYKSLTGKKKDVFFEARGFFVPPSDLDSAEHGGVSLLKGRRVIRICPDEKKAFLDDDSVISYNKCLLAPGGKPKTIDELDSADPKVKERVIYFRGVDDYRKLDELCSEGKSITIIGGGFLGSELSYGIKRKYENVEINQVVSESGHLSNILPEYLAHKATEAVQRVGVNVISNAKITGARKANDKVDLKLSNSRSVRSDYVLVAIGIKPDTSLAEASGLEVDPLLGGISSDAELRVRSGIYAAGDACCFFDKSLGRRRVEHWENAQISGRLAGENMTGAEKAFWYQPSFFTKISPEHHINAVGNTDSSLKTVSIFAKEDPHNEKHYERGVVFYKGENDRVVGVLLVNVFGPSIDVARRIIEEGRPVGDFKELAKLFPLFENAKDNEN